MNFAVGLSGAIFKKLMCAAIKFARVLRPALANCYHQGVSIIDGRFACAYSGPIL